MFYIINTMKKQTILCHFFSSDIKKAPENAFSGIFTYLKLVLKYNFVIFLHILCKTYDESLQKQAVNMDLQCILCIANSSYAVKTPKDKVT